MHAAYSEGFRKPHCIPSAAKPTAQSCSLALFQIQKENAECFQFVVLLTEKNMDVYARKTQHTYFQRTKDTLIHCPLQQEQAFKWEIYIGITDVN